MLSIIIALFLGPILARARLRDDAAEDAQDTTASSQDDATSERRQLNDLTVMLRRLQHV